MTRYLSPEAKEKAKKLSRDYYYKNRERLLEQKKEYRLKNIDLMREKDRRYAKNNPEKKRLSDKNYLENRCNKVNRKLKRKEWEERNKEKLIDYQKEYRKKHKQYLNVQKQSRLNEVKQLVYEIFGGKCQNCGDTELSNLTMHHVHGRTSEKKHGGHKISGKKLWMMIFMENCPKNKYEMLCWNCHIGDKHNRPKKIKKCPHCGKDI